MPKWCEHDNNLIVWDEEKHCYVCEICNRKKCGDCGLGLLFSEPEVYCGRCENKRHQIMVGIL